MKLKTYAFELAHDGGRYFVRVQASSMKEAKRLVMQMEKCPERAIEWAHVVKPTSLMGG